MRKSAVAGKFYSDSPTELQKEVSSFINVPSKKQNALGALSPHAGYVYSGAVAGAVFSAIDLPKSFVIIGPNHSGRGETASINSKEEWKMPGAIIKMNSRLAEIIKSKNNAIKEDSIGHRYEHSLEVQIPFIQSFLDDFDIVPICIQHLDYSTCKEMGIAIARSIKEYGEPVLIVASSDMTHYESQKSAEQKDRMAIDQIIKLDPKGLFDTVRKNSISMCGFIPATIMLTACKELRAKRAEMIKYMTSGDVSGDYDQVVGYSGVVVV